MTRELSFAKALFIFPVTCALAVPAAAETGSVEVDTQVILPITLSNTQSLDFGRIVPSGGLGRVTINARNGNRNGNANVTLLGTESSRGLFVGTGEGGMTVTITGSAGQIVLTGPGDAMEVRRLRVSRNNGGQRTLPRNYNIPNNGTINIGFGGRLFVGRNQAPGLYSGTFDLTMEYQ